MNAVGFIFARGGSKGLPGKNIRPLYGMPLIAWAIKQAKEVQGLRRVIVSTDSTEIANVAKKFGAEAPFLRPPQLASDVSPEWLSWVHALNYLKSDEGCLPEAFVSIPATAPLREARDIQHCLDKFSEGYADAVITVTEAHRNPYFNMVTCKADGTVNIVLKPETPISRRQDAPVVYDMTTVAFVAKPEFVLSNNSIFDGVVKAVTVPNERAIDIDTLLDFEMAEKLMELKYKGPLCA